MRITGLTKVVLTIGVLAALCLILMSTQRARAQARCIYADGSVDVGVTANHGGKCQKCGTDGQWFDVPASQCPGCQDSKIRDTVEIVDKGRIDASDPSPDFCTDEKGRKYSLGALRFTNKCMRCDSHAQFSEDSASTCQECKSRTLAPVM
jgi:hypothetical protein